MTSIFNIGSSGSGKYQIFERGISCQVFPKLVVLQKKIVWTASAVNRLVLIANSLKKLRPVFLGAYSWIGLEITVLCFAYIFEL